eukprot:4468019-Lingulodinium_polyedra.AAC.1
MPRPVRASASFSRGLPTLCRTRSTSRELPDPPGSGSSAPTCRMPFTKSRCDPTSADSPAPPSGVFSTSSKSSSLEPGRRPLYGGGSPRGSDAPPRPSLFPRF